MNDGTRILDRTGARRRRWALCALAVALGLTLAVPALADGPGLDELLELGPEPEQRDQPAAERDALDEDARRTLERQRAAADAFRQAVREMGDVGRRLSDQLDAGVSTQRAQQAILDKLDQVIEAARQQQAGGGGGGGGGGGEAREQDAGAGDVAQQSEGDGQDNGDEPGAAGEPNGSGEHAGGYSPGQAREDEVEDTPLEQLQREWGNLPPRLRDEISEGLDEPYSPVYRDLTEAYYRRLAEEEQ